MAKYDINLRYKEKMLKGEQTNLRKKEDTRREQWLIYLLRLHYQE